MCEGNELRPPSNQIMSRPTAVHHAIWIRLHPTYPIQSFSLHARLRIAPGYDMINPHNHLDEACMYGVCVQTTISLLFLLLQHGREIRKAKEKRKVYESLRPATTESNHGSTAKTGIRSFQETRTEIEKNCRSARPWLRQYGR